MTETSDSLLVAQRPPRITLGGFWQSVKLDLLAHSPRSLGMPWWRRTVAVVWTFFMGSSFHMLFLHRCGHALHNARLVPLSLLIEKINYHLYHCIIPASVRFGPGVWIPHPLGIVIAQGSVIGRRVYIFQHAQLIKTQGREEAIHVGDRVFLMASSMVIGSQIGEESIVAAAAVVTRSVPPRHIAMGVPAKNSPLADRQLWLIPSDVPGGPNIVADVSAVTAAIAPDSPA